MLLPRRGGLKRRWRTELKSSVWEPHWHPRTLGNAIQALQRSIVRITIVRGKGNFAVQSQIVSRLPPNSSPLSPSEQVIMKIESRHWHYLAESYFSLWSGGEAGTLLNLEHEPLPWQVHSFLFVPWSQTSSGTFLRASWTSGSRSSPPSAPVLHWHQGSCTWPKEGSAFGNCVARRFCCSCIQTLQPHWRGGVAWCLKGAVWELSCFPSSTNVLLLIVDIPVLADQCSQSVQQPHPPTPLPSRF